ncbi:hypothetical protein [Streptomyces fractus]|uniref:hypothetical protein n=1 Tax=Streptomyces fractus TaxID=641806 RepID=UPI003CE8289D
MTTAPRTPPRVLLEPELLHSSPKALVWHDGLIAGVRGLTLSLGVQAGPEAPKAAMFDDEWEETDPLTPVGITLRPFGSPAAVLALPAPEGTRNTMRWTADFGDVEPHQALLDIYIKPLGLHITRMLDGTGEQNTPEAAQQDIAAPRPRLLAGPEILYDEDGYVVWQHGVVVNPAGLHSTLEVIVDPSRTDIELLGDGWQLGERGEGSPPPLGIRITDGGQPVVAQRGGIAGSERALTCSRSFPSPASRYMSAHFDVPPLGLSASRELHDVRA